MMEEFIIIYFIAILGIAMIYTKITHDLLNPLILFYTPLTVNFLLYYCLYRSESKLSQYTVLLIFLGSLSFLCGYSLTTMHHMKTKTQDVIYPLIINSKIKTVMLIFGIIGWFTGLYEFIYFGLNGISSFFINVRRNYMYGAGVSPISKYGTFVLFLASCVYLYDYCEKGGGKRKKYLLLFMVLGSVSSSCFSMARTTLLAYALAYAYIYLRGLIDKVYRKKMFSRKKIRRYYLVLCAGFIILLLIFFLFVQKLGKAGAEKLFDKEFFLYKYLGYSLVAFDKYIKDFPGMTRGYYSLGAFGKILMLFGIYKRDMLENIGAPVGEFNVYSYMSSLYLDYGILGLIFPMFLIGTLSGILYHKVQQRSGWWTIFYANFAYALVIAFYAYQFSNTTFIYCLFFMFALSVHRGRFLVYAGKRKGYTYHDKGYE